MAIVATEINILGKANRIIGYRCQDHLDIWHNYGPIISSDPNFDAEAHKIVVAKKMERFLADSEFNSIVKEIE